MEKSNPILAIIPMGIPGIGKSKVFENLIKNGEALKKFQFSSVSSDDIRKECMDKYMAKNPKADEDEAFKGTAGPYKGAFYKALGNAASKHFPGKIHCIIVDKNHPGNGISSSVEYFLYMYNFIEEFIANLKILHNLRL